MENLLLQLSMLPHWKIGLLTIALLLQGAVITVFPEEMVITALGILVSQQRIGFLEAAIAVQIGLLPANAALFWIGRRFGRRVLSFGPIRSMFGGKALAHARMAFRKYGDSIIALTRFTPLVRGPVYLAAGLSKMRFRRFAMYDFSASIIQIPLLLALGYFLGKTSANVVDAYRREALLTGAAILLLIAYKFIPNRTLKNS